MSLNRLFLTLALLTYFNVNYAQTDSEIDPIRLRIVNNYDSISKFKTLISKQDIEGLLVGNWHFINIQRQDGKIIDTLKIEYYDNNGERHHFKPETVTRPDIKFSSKGEYFISDTPLTNKSVGTWSYIDSIKSLTLYYKKPYFPDPMMETVLKLPGLKSEDLWIYRITSEDLYIMETYPINEYEKWFNLLHYKKTSR